MNDDENELSSFFSKGHHSDQLTVDGSSLPETSDVSGIDHSYGLEHSHHDLTEAIDLDPIVSHTNHEIAIDPARIQDALDEAMARSSFDTSVDDVSAGWLSNLQGITAEYLVADALNHSGDGLTYHLYSDLNHPDVDIAGVSADGSIVRLLQVKATSSGTYAETGRHPGVELIATSDGVGAGMIGMGFAASDLRAEIRQLLEE